MTSCLPAPVCSMKHEPGSMASTSLSLRRALMSALGFARAPYSGSLRPNEPTEARPRDSARSHSEEHVWEQPLTAAASNSSAHSTSVPPALFTAMTSATTPLEPWLSTGALRDPFGGAVGSRTASALPAVQTPTRDARDHDCKQESTEPKPS